MDELMVGSSEDVARAGKEPIYKCYNWQTKERRVLPESEAFNLDKRLWEITLCDADLIGVDRDILMWVRNVYFNPRDGEVVGRIAALISIRRWEDLVGVRMEQIAAPVKTEAI